MKRNILEKQKRFSNYTSDKELITSIGKALQNFVPKASNHSVRKQAN